MSAQPLLLFPIHANTVSESRSARGDVERRQRGERQLTLVIVMDVALQHVLHAGEAGPAAELAHLRHIDSNLRVNDPLGVEGAHKLNGLRHAIEVSAERVRARDIASLEPLGNAQLFLARAGRVSANGHIAEATFLKGMLQVASTEDCNGCVVVTRSALRISVRIAAGHAVPAAREAGPLVQLAGTELVGRFADLALRADAQRHGPCSRRPPSRCDQFPLAVT